VEFQNENNDKKTEQLLASLSIASLSFLFTEFSLRLSGFV